MHKVPREKIIIGPRQRSGDVKELLDADLCDSILSKGLLHPIVVLPKEENFVLVAGGRRLANIDAIAKTGKIFFCNKEEILPGTVPTIFLNELNTVLLAKAEFEENELRSELDWTDRAKALAYIYDLEIANNPEKSIKDVAESLSKETKVPVKTLQNAFTISKVIVENLSDPAIAKARNATDAYSLILKRNEATTLALLAKQNASIPISCKILEGDCCTLMPTLEEGSIDLIVADPPYGISVGGEGFRSRTVHHHNYADSKPDAQRVVQTILTEGFRLTKTRANLFLFCDIDLWQWIRDSAERAGWTPFRTPIIWAKSDSEGLAPWGSQGFRRTYEIIFFATKGQRGLISSPVDILRFNRVARNERDYGAAKPPALIKELIVRSTLPGDLVLDPCCGSGATLVAAHEAQRRVIGIEKDKNAYNLSMAKMAELKDNADVKSVEPKISDL